MTDAINNLAPVFRTAITSIMDVERQPVTRLQNERDSVSVRRGVYMDLKGSLESLQSKIKALMTSQGSTLSAGRKANVIPSSDATILTATASSSAAFANYNIAITRLARAQTRASAEQASAEGALGLFGTIQLGGTGTAGYTLTPTSTVTAASVSSVATGNRELGSGDYRLETRTKDGVAQFRLVDADGVAVSIATRSGSGTTNDWQRLSAGVFDTGRGLSLSLGGTAANASTTVGYTAAGTSVAVTTGQSLQDIATAINAASQPEGRDVVASVVGKQLVFTAAKEGLNHSMVYTDGVGLGFGADTQAAQNALFTVNGVSVNSATNANITGVINGVTLSLASDGEGKSAGLSVTSDTSAARKAIEAMVGEYNKTMAYLTTKTAVTVTTVGEKTTYDRGPLSSDTAIRSLRYDMTASLGYDVSVDGSYNKLSDIGLTVGEGFKLNIDTTKLDQALQSNFSDVTELLDTALDKLNTALNRFTGASGSIQGTLDSLDDHLEGYDRRIASKKERLTERQEYLVTQYAEMQAQLVYMQNDYTMFQAMYGSSSNINLTG